MNLTNTTDPFFSTMSERTSGKQNTLMVIRIAVILLCIGIIVLQGVFMIMVFVVLPRVITRNDRMRLPVRFDKWLAKLDMFPKRHWVPMRSTLVKRKTMMGGLCSIMFIVFVLTIVTLTVAEFFTINQFERMTIVAEHILARDFSRSVDTRVPGDYIFSFTLHNVMDPQCTLSSYSIVGLISAKVNTGPDDDSSGDQSIRIETTRLKESAACKFEVNCMNCFLSSYNPTVSLRMDDYFSMASSISYHVQLPHFHDGSQLVVEQVIAPGDLNLILKGPKQTLIPLSLTKSVYSRLSDDYFVYSLFSDVLNFAPQRRSNPMSIGYSVVHNPIELGSVADASNFHSQRGLSLRLSLQINPNALLIEQESEHTSLDLVSKTCALMSSLAVIVVILMNCVEEHCMHSLPRRTKSLSIYLRKRTFSAVIENNQDDGKPGDNQDETAVVSDFIRSGADFEMAIAEDVEEIRKSMSLVGRVKMHFSNEIDGDGAIEPGVKFSDVQDSEAIELEDLGADQNVSEALNSEITELRARLSELCEKMEERLSAERVLRSELEVKSTMLMELKTGLKEQVSAINELRRRIQHD